MQSTHFVRTAKCNYQEDPTPVLFMLEWWAMQFYEPNQLPHYKPKRSQTIPTHFTISYHPLSALRIQKKHELREIERWGTESEESVNVENYDCIEEWIPSFEKVRLYQFSPGCGWINSSFPCIQMIQIQSNPNHSFHQDLVVHFSNSLDLLNSSKSSP